MLTTKFFIHVKIEWTCLIYSVSYAMLTTKFFIHVKIEWTCLIYSVSYVAFDIDVVNSRGEGWEDGIIAATPAEFVFFVLCFLTMFLSIILSIFFSPLYVLLPEVITPRYCLLDFVIVLYSVTFFQDSLSSQSY